MKLLYAGSFNPFHKGHLDIYQKAAKLGKVDLAMYVRDWETNYAYRAFECELPNTQHLYFGGKLVDYLKNKKYDTLVRGLRNGSDLQYEQNMLYWNEDLGIEIPTIFILCDRNLSHISSTSIREVSCLNQTK